MGLMRECLCFQAGPVCVSKQGLSVFGCVWVMRSAENSGWVGDSDVAIWALGVRVLSDVH